MEKRASPGRRRKRRPGKKLVRAEQPYRDRGFRLLAGVDEAGVGPLAGPVVAAAVIMRPDSYIKGVWDSKVIPAEERDELALRIRAEAVSLAIGLARPREIDRINILQATLISMRRAVVRLDPAPEFVLVDARTIPRLDMPQEGHVKGDATFYHIACASILAKTWRDAIMDKLDRRFPGYGFSHNRGYPTPDHREAIRALGPCGVHRRSFRWLPVEQYELDLTAGDGPDSEAERAALVETASEGRGLPG